MESANIVIIGAGVIGLAIAAKLSESNEDVYVLEKNTRIGQEISTHNSGVIHSGIHYTPNSLKAKLCVRGNSMLYDICKEHNIPFKCLGKLTVATNVAEINTIRELFANGVQNGVIGLKMIDRKEIKELEPNVEADQALYSPSSGIVDQDGLIEYFNSRAVGNNAVISTGTQVIGIRKADSGYELSGISVGRPFNIRSETVINCAGLYADQVASFVGLNPEKCGYKINFYKGDYYRVLGYPLVQKLVYPVPHGAGLGIHLTPDLGGSIRLGPNAYLVSDINYLPNSRESEFRDDVARFLPCIKERTLQYDSSGIRPKLQGSERAFKDFIIRHEADRDLRGFINLIGIESPGLTASPAIAEYVSNIYKKEIMS